MIELGAPILGEPEKAAVCAVLDDGWITMGERVKRFEREFARLHETEDAVAVNSATAALQLSLAVWSIGPGDEVIVPSLTFVATSNVILHAGATPVFGDVVAPGTPHLSLAEAERLLTARTRAILVVHYGGYLIDLAPWRAFAAKHNLVLLEDSAHASGLPGAAAAQSDGASFSFFTNKNMTTAEGGMLVVPDPERRQRARWLRAHGMTATTLDRAKGNAVGYDVVDCGHNFRMDELRAAIGLVQLERLSGWNETRRKLTAHYREMLPQLAPGVTVPFDSSWTTSAHILPALLPQGTDRPAVIPAMKAGGIQTSVHYPPIHRFTYYQDRFPGLSLPQTEAFSARVLTLPLHPRLSESDVERVCRTLGQALNT